MNKTYGLQILLGAWEQREVKPLPIYPAAPGALVGNQKLRIFFELSDMLPRSSSPKLEHVFFLINADGHRRRDSTRMRKMEAL